MNFDSVAVNLHFRNDVRLAGLNSHPLGLEILGQFLHVDAALVEVLPALLSDVNINPLLGGGKVQKRLDTFAEQDL